MVALGTMSAHRDTCEQLKANTTNLQPELMTALDYPTQHVVDPALIKEKHGSLLIFACQNKKIRILAHVPKSHVT